MNSRDVSNQDLVGVMRAQAWERAKGELRSILAAYFDDRNRFDAMDKLVSKFVIEVEENGLAE